MNGGQKEKELKKWRKKLSLLIQANILSFAWRNLEIPPEIFNHVRALLGRCLNPRSLKQEEEMVITGPQAISSVVILN
jgi:hypothetical protein